MLKELNRFGEKISKLFGESKKEQEDPDVFAGDPISHLLPWEAYDEETGIFVGKESLGFTLEAIPLVGSAESVQREIASIFQEILEEGESIQCLLWADHRVASFLQHWENARDQSKEIYREIAHRRAEHLQTTKELSPRLFRFILSFSTQEKYHSLTKEKLKKKKERILKTLQSFTYVYAWDPDHFLESVGAFLNFSSRKDVEPRHWNPFQSLSSQLSTGGMLHIDDHYLEWETEKTAQFKTFRTVDQPNYWSLVEMQKLIGDVFRDAFRIQHPFYLHYGVHCPKQSKEEGKFKRRSYLVEKQGRSPFLLRLIPALEEELKETQLVRKELAENSKFVWTQFTAGIWTNEAEMSFAEQSLKSLFRINQFTLTENRYLHLPIFLSSLPMSWADYLDDLKRLNLLRSTVTSECAALVPIQGEWMGTKSAGMLLLGRRGQLANWNPFDNKTGNFNVVVTGRSGSGKSVFMQDLLLSGLGTGAKVYILEVGRSFEKLCTLLEGQHIEFSKESNLCLNPFTHLSNHDSEERDTSIGFLKNIIACMAAPSTGTGDYENGLIEKAIRYAWEQKQNRATITDVAHWLQSQQEESAKRLGIMLTPYTNEGVYSKYFEGENNIDFTSPMVLIELEELKEKKDLQAVVIQLFIMTITNQAFLGDRTQRFYICIDEAWDLLRGKQTGLFIETLARRLRKYNGSLVIGTQNVDDFFSSAGALAAYENSDWMCLLAQKEDSINRFCEKSKIDENKQYALKSVAKRENYSEIMICDADGNYSIQRLILDPFSRLLYSTSAEEFSYINQLQQEGMTIAQAIDHIVTHKKV